MRNYVQSVVAKKISPAQMHGAKRVALPHIFLVVGDRPIAPVEPTPTGRNELFYFLLFSGVLYGFL